ncbi:F-box domain containing protein [Parasponia andersonii]|uniref:F-box domain containing protein n=1 Tax=Parasponia andersonii TaxID=3476 RepID=A0A2P5AN68_PARAD|nr:F-box domain containing protein [Parasponia andersonii]
MQQYRRHQPHFPAATPDGGAAAITPTSSEDKRGKRRGSYNCGRCGLPKKGHSCNIGGGDTTPTEVSGDVSVEYSLSTTRPPPPRQPYSHLRRALSFDEVDNGGGGGFDPPEADDDEFFEPTAEMESDLGSGGLPARILWEVLRRLPPPGLLSAAKVCKGWRETTRRLWRAAEVLRLRVPLRAQIGIVGSVLHKCPGLVSLTLRMESDVDATMLACIAFSCPNLESMEISMADNALNRITGDELGRFVAERRMLKSLKMEGCFNLGGFVLCSTSLTTLWLSDLSSLSKMVFNCPSLKEISLEFSRQASDSTDLISMAECLGRGCPRLQNIHIASVRLSHAVVLALTAAQLRGLRMLSLVLGSEITDASVAAISQSYPNLELLDLSGSGISDSGIGMICNVFPDTLTRLLVALCPNITSSGIQFATAQLPLLELMDCGMAICDPSSQDPTSEESSGCEIQKTSNAKVPLIYQNLIIKHSRLKKLSLWGCSGLSALYLNCPELNDLNLNSCKNLHPERLSLQCPNLESVHALGCEESLTGAIRCQVNNRFDMVENVLLYKRLADGSKRVRVPLFLNAQLHDDDIKRRKVETPKCNVIVS